MASSTSTQDTLSERIACSIQVLGHDHQQALDFVQRVLNTSGQSLSKVRSPNLPPPSLLFLATNGAFDTPTPDIAEVPWTIDNKYYTAKVAFHIRTDMSDTDPLAFKTRTAAAMSTATQIPGVLSPPAFIYLLPEEGVQDKHDLIPLLFDSISTRFEPEIGIAVRTTGSGEVVCDTDDIEEAFDDIGFEYVDEEDDGNSNNEDDSDEDRRDVTGIERIIQSLHAYQWPNLVLKEKPKRSASSQAVHLSEGPPHEETFTTKDPSLSTPSSTVLPSILNSGPSNSTNSLFEKTSDDVLEKSSHLAEIKALENWLDSEEDAVWSTNETTPVSSSSTRGVSTTTAALQFSAGDSSAFDDDFSPFVTAPAVVPSSSKANHPDLSIDDVDAIGDTFNYLTAMRKEIAAIGDDNERRDVAARAAMEMVNRLGL